MPDCVHIRPEGVAGEIWRGTTKLQLEARVTSELLRQIVQVDSGTVNEGDLFDLVTGFSPPPLDLKGFAAARRFRAETGGIVADGMAIATDPDSQRKIAELRRRTAAGEIAVPIAFKAGNGWFALGAAAIEVIDRAVAAHVAVCFETEYELAEAIDAGAVTTLEAIEARFDQLQASIKGE